jgi:hypothetical protein
MFFKGPFVLYLQRLHASILIQKYLVMQVSIRLMPSSCIFFLFISCGTSSFYNGHKDHELACATKFKIWIYYFL